MFTQDLKLSDLTKLAVWLQKLAGHAIVFVEKVVLTTFSTDLRVHTHVTSYFAFSALLLRVKIVTHLASRADIFFTNRAKREGTRSAMYSAVNVVC